MKTKALSLFLALLMLVSMIPMAAMAAGSSDCDHLGGAWTPNGDVTHSSTCECGEYVDGPYPCQSFNGVTCYMCKGSMTPEPVCDHTRNDWAPNGDGTHSSACDCGENVAGPYTCYAGSGTTCLTCGGAVVAAPQCQHGFQNVINNNDGTHKFICRDCGVLISSAVHSYNEFDTCVCGAIKPAAPVCDHVRNDWTSNGDGTHTSSCDCGENVAGPYACQTLNGVTCLACGADMPGTAACQHESQDLVSNGVWTHNVVCSDCEEVLSTSRHQYNFFTHVCACGAVDPMYQFMCPHNHHHLVNNGSNHKVVCDHCKFVHYYEPHGYNDSGVCSCGAIKPACLHSRFDTVNNGANHNIVCYDCGIVIFAEAHSYNAYDMCICGAVNPNVVPEVIPEEPAPIYPDDAWQRLDELFTTFK